MFDFRRLIDLKTQCRGITEQEGHRIKRKMEQFFPVKRFASCNEEFLGYAEGDFSRKLMRLAFPKNCSQIQLVIFEGSLEVKLPTIWTDEKQSRAEAERRGRLEERRSEEKE